MSIRTLWRCRSCGKSDLAPGVCPTPFCQSLSAGGDLHLQHVRGLRTFVLVRSKDHSGVSGTGVVATGVQFPDGKVCTRWDATMRAAAQTAVWDSIEDVLAIHGHNGDTQVVWVP